MRPFFNAPQRSWYRRVIKTAVGGTNSHRKRSTLPKSNYSGLYMYAKYYWSLETATMASSKWSTEDCATQSECATVAVNYNRSVASGREGLYAQIRAFKAGLGSLGSSDPRCPMLIKAIYDLLNRPGSLLAYLWERKIDGCGLKFDAEIPRRVPTMHSGSFSRVVAWVERNGPRVIENGTPPRNP